MEEFKGTKGEFIVRDLFETYEIVSDTPYSVATIEKKYRTLYIIKSNANLICEAFNVVTRTGLTPEQMEDLISQQNANMEAKLFVISTRDKTISDLEARLKEACVLIEEMVKETETHYPVLAESGYHILHEKRKSFLTKEKTK